MSCLPPQKRIILDSTNDTPPVLPKQRKIGVARNAIALSSVDLGAGSSNDGATNNSDDSVDLAHRVTAGKLDHMDMDDATRDFRKHVLNLWISNKQSALFVHTWAKKATAAAARGLRDAANLGAGGLHPQQMSRDLLRIALVGCIAPPLYWASILIWNADLGQCVPHDIPFFASARKNICSVGIWSIDSVKCHSHIKPSSPEDYSKSMFQT